MLPNEDIIPITYMGGSGGNFLCHFIVSAKRNSKDVIELSEHGNAHKGLKEFFSPPYGLMQPDKDKIDSIFAFLEDTKTQTIYSSIKKPYYTSVHIADLNIINTYFKKSIRITYDPDDIDELIKVFYGKWFIDEDKGRLWKNIKISFMSSAKTYQSKFTKLENMPNVLFVSWKELFKGNIEECISKLSIFTSIDKDNFSRESLMHWRDKTKYCIDKFTKI